ncbi:MAG: pre-peptidase C-terminal domain-containing protein [Bacteroidota bacterium]
MRKHTLHNAVQIALLGASLIAGVAYADDEIEPNQPIGSAQPVTIVPGSGGEKGSATVHGVLGNLTGSPVGDVDFYSFYGLVGDVVTVDIDGGIGGARSVDTIVAVFGPAPGYKKLRENDDAGFPLDPGSTSPYDSRIDNFLLPATGTYTVGVSSYPRRFTDGGGLMSSSLNSKSNGDYTLIISGVSPPVLQINIDIKPGDGDSAAPINPKSKGKIPVALLSSAEFNAVTVKTDSLRFGPTGSEASLSACGNDGEDVNGDGLLDLVCHFDNQRAAFSATDEEGIVKGMTDDGRAFEGRGRLKVVPAKRAY